MMLNITLFYALGIIFANTVNHIPVWLYIIVFVASLINLALINGRHLLLIVLISFFIVGAVNTVANPFIPCRAADEPAVIVSIRESISSQIKNLLPEKEATFLLGLLVGDKAVNIDRKMQDDFRKVGLSHVLVVSGMHISMLVGIITALLCAIRINRPAQLAIICGCLAFFTLLCGASASILRAVFMAGIVLIAGNFKREVNFIEALSFSAFILLLISPANLFNVGFQLSLAATLGVGGLAPYLNQHINLRAPAEIKQLMTVSIAPYVLTLPIILYTFNQVSIVAVTVNMLVLPWVNLIVIGGLLTLFAAFIFKPAALLAALLLRGLIGILLYLVESAAALPFSTFNIGQIPLAIVFLAYLSIAYISLNINNKRALTNFTFVILPIVAVFALSGMTFSAPKLLEVCFIDVGQGDSIFIHAGGKYNILVDGGEEWAGERRVLPYLRSKGVNSLDMLVVTHPHDDHLAGVLPILHNIKVKQIVDNGDVYDSFYYKRFIASIQENQIKYSRVCRGNTIQLGSTTTLSVLSPPGQLFCGTESDINNNSLVIKLDCGQFSLLLTGDMEREGEEDLLASGIKLGCDVIKAGHHGSSNASSGELLDEVKPNVCIISVGKKNRFRHPHKAALGRYKSRGIKVLRTDKHGHITITSDGKSYWIDASKGES